MLRFVPVTYSGFGVSGIMCMIPSLSIKLISGIIGSASSFAQIIVGKTIERTITSSKQTITLMVFDGINIANIKTIAFNATIDNKQQRTWGNNILMLDSKPPIIGNPMAIINALPTTIINRAAKVVVRK